MDVFSYLLGKQQGGSSGGGRDWSEIGYSSEPESIQDGFDYAKSIKDNWDSSVTSLASKFNEDRNLIYMPLVDTSNATMFLRMFAYCTSLVQVPLLDTSKATMAFYMFDHCSALESVPLFDFSHLTSFTNMFSNCAALKSIPAFDTGSATDFSSAFSTCTSLESIPALNTSNATNMSAIFSGCSSLKTIEELNCEQVTIISNAFYNCKSLINLGGFKNLGQNYSTSSSANAYALTLNISASNNLTHDSLMNVINKVYDIATKGVATQSLTIGSTNVGKLTAEEIAIATNKGWSIS
jgi:surface protein